MKTFASQLFFSALLLANFGRVGMAQTSAIEAPAPVAAPAPVVAAGVSPATSTEGRYELKKKSAFSVGRDVRIPFRPIGWVKGTAVTPVAPGVPTLVFDEKAFSVTSILLGAQAFAIINGRTYSEGEFLRATKGSSDRKVRVIRISDGHVTLQCEGQTIVVAQRRPELQERKQDVDLLNEEK